jgi:DNA-binding transcriptional LysR family regulator
MLRLNDELLRRFDNTREGIVLRVGIPNDFSVAMLPMALSRFAAAEPGVILGLHSDLSLSLLEGLRTSQFDLVVAMTTDRATLRSRSEPSGWCGSPDPTCSQPPTGRCR